MNRLGELERAIMDVLWDAVEPLTVRQVGLRLTNRDLAHTTVMTVLDRLAKKNVVTRRKVGRAFVYIPEISRDAIRRLALKEFVDCFFDGSEQRLTEFLRRSGADEPATELAVDAGMDAALL